MTILCYHTVEPAWNQTLAVTPTEFERQCRTLAARRDVRPLDAVVTTLDRAFRPRGRISAITFDDGWRGVYEHAWPILRRFGLPFTVFVVADTVTIPDRAADWVIDPPAQGLEVLTRDQIRELHEAGVDIASHSLRHADLTSLGYDECVRDLLESRELLEDLLESKVRTLAYPSGRHDEDVRRAAEKAGFVAAFTLPERVEPVGPFAIPRVGVYPGNTTTAFWLKTRRRYLDLRLDPRAQAARDLVTSARRRTLGAVN
jgi:peptidoglycan/xylan/chitin deacetylase (PgdA/CDA1 family)